MNAYTVRVRLNTVTTVHGAIHGNRNQERPAVRVSESGMRQASKKNATELAVELIDTEMHRLQELLKKVEADDVVFNSFASLLPAQADLNRIIRYETHLSREIDREMNHLERRQRARRGYPPPPTIKLDVS